MQSIESTTISSYTPSFYEINCAHCGINLIDERTGRSFEQDYEVCKCCGHLFCSPKCWHDHKKETLHKNVI